MSCTNVLEVLEVSLFKEYYKLDILVSRPTLSGDFAVSPKVDFFLFLAVIVLILLSILSARYSNSFFSYLHKFNNVPLLKSIN